MKFSLRAPCANCPFRRDCLPGWLGRPRAEEIAGYLETENKTFACHKTTDRKKIDREHCAGALHLIEKTGAANQMAQLAERLGLWAGPEQLKGQHLTFDTFREFEAHHEAKKR